MMSMTLVQAKDGPLPSLTPTMGLLSLTRSEYKTIDFQFKIKYFLKIVAFKIVVFL